MVSRPALQEVQAVAQVPQVTWTEVPQLTAKDEVCTAFQSPHLPLLPQPLTAAGEEAGAGDGCGRQLLVSSLLSTCQAFTGGIEAVFPVWLTKHLWDDVLAKMLQNSITKAALMIQDG